MVVLFDKQEDRPPKYLFPAIKTSEYQSAKESWSSPLSNVIFWFGEIIALGVGQWI